MMIRILMAAAVLMALPGLAMAQTGGHQGHGTPARAADTASTRALKAATDKMHRDMDIRYTGDADRDFVAGMIAHHQGAIDVARAVLQHGKDPEIRKLAQDLIDAQEKEIAQMKAWQGKR